MGNLKDLDLVTPLHLAARYGIDRNSFRSFYYIKEALYKSALSFERSLSVHTVCKVKHDIVFDQFDHYRDTRALYLGSLHPRNFYIYM